MWKVLRFFVIAAVLGVAQGGCSTNLQQDAIAGVYNQIRDVMQSARDAVDAFAIQVKYFHSQSGESKYKIGPAPQKVDDVENGKAQQSLYNVKKFHKDLNMQLAWSTGEYISYKNIGDRLFLGFRGPPNDDGTPAATSYYVPNEVGLQAGAEAIPDLGSIDYDPTKESWYTEAFNACSADNNNYYTCQAVVSSLQPDKSKEYFDLTVALGFPNWNGRTKFKFNDGIYPFGGLGVVANEYQPSKFNGVVAADITTSKFGPILKSAVQNSGATMGYIMDTGLKIVATSDDTSVIVEKKVGDKVTYAQMSVSESKSPLLVQSASYLTENMFLSDATLPWDEGKDSISRSITVRKYFLHGVKWYMVIVGSYSDTERCDFKEQGSVLASVVAEVSAALSAAVNAGDFMLGGINMNLYKGGCCTKDGNVTATQPPTRDDLWKLGSQGTLKEEGPQEPEINLQNMLITTGLAFPQIAWVYVGYAKKDPNVKEGSFIGYIMKDDGGFKEMAVMTSDEAPVRYKYYVDAQGYTSNPANDIEAASITPSYLVTQRPWYKAAAAAGRPVWSAPYVFSTASLGIGLTYSLPFYEGVGANRVLAGCIGIDITLLGVKRILAGFAGLGVSYYAIETSESPVMSKSKLPADYNMLVSSSGAEITNVANTAQLKAYSKDVKDYLVFSSAEYMKDNDIVYDSTIKTKNLDCTVRNYRKIGLNWRFVGVAWKYVSAAGNGIGQVTSDATKTAQEAFPYDITNMMSQNMGIIASTLCIVIFQFIVTLVMYLQSKKKAHHDVVANNAQAASHFHANGNGHSNPLHSKRSSVTGAFTNQKRHRVANVVGRRPTVVVGSDAPQHQI